MHESDDRLKGFLDPLLKPLAGLFEGVRHNRSGWLIVGAHCLARDLAEIIIAECHLPVALLDTDARQVIQARREGLHAEHQDALAVEGMGGGGEFAETGNLLALSHDPALNLALARRCGDSLGVDRVFGWFAGLPSSGLPVGARILPRVRSLPDLSGEVATGRARVSVFARTSPTTARAAGLEPLAVIHGRRIRFLSGEPDSYDSSRDLLVALSRQSPP